MIDFNLFILGSQLTPALGGANVLDYFADSNLAGQVVIFVLVIMNCYALALMFSKYNILKRAKINNARDEKKLNDLPSVYDYDNALFAGEGSPYLHICSRAMAAARKSSQGGPVRMNYVENAIRRALAEMGEQYEDRMYWLATIVSGAPFLGLLGTVWGVMDAFGTMESGGATIEHLAPGVSGALLTTVTALCVAIPIVFVYNGLLGMARSGMTKMENFASNLADRIEIEERS